MQTILILLAAVTAILMVAWLIARQLRQRPTIQDLVWRTTLVAVAMTPVALLARGALTDHQWSLVILPAVQTDVAATEAGDAPVRTDHDTSGGRLNWNMRPARRPAELPTPAEQAVDLEQDPAAATVVNAAASTATSATSIESAHSTVAAPPRDWGMIFGVAVASIWGCGVCLHLIRIVRAASNSNRLLHTSLVVTDAAALELNCWCARRVGLPGTTRLSTHDEVTGPVVTGLVTPTIVIPPALLSPSARHDLRAALLHENGHLRRHDLAFDLLLRLVTAVLWFHPLTLLMAHELRRLREELCDNHVLREERPVTYAEMLLRLALDQRLTESRLIGLGMFTRPHRLESRVDAILSSNRPLATSTTRKTRHFVLIATGVCLIGALFVRLDHARLAANDGLKDSDAKLAQKKSQSEDTQAKPNEQAALETKPAAITFMIVDSAGKPIEGVAVTPWALSISGGSFFTDHKWDTSQTDAEGRVVIPLAVGISQTVTSVLGHPGPDGIESIGFRAEHPNYPIWSNYLRLIGDNPTLALSDPVTIQVRAQREGETVAATRLYPDVTNTHSKDWSEADGVLTYRNLDLTTSRWLRVAQIPEQGPAWFSEVVDLQHLAGNPISISVTLKPSSRVTGRLSNDVPRPIKNGRVFGSVVSPHSADYYQSTWTATTKIAEDGSFVLEALPPDETLQLIAICDGWISRSPLKTETEAYSQQHGFPKGEASDPRAGMVLPQLVWLGERNIDTAVPMTATGSCEITALDDKTEQPLANVEIQFSPNQLFHQAGSTYLGSGYDELAAARARLAGQNNDPKGFRIDPERRYQAKTNDQGVAVITELPGVTDGPAEFRQMMFFAYNETHVGLPNEPLPFRLVLGTQPLLARVTAGKTEQLTIRMVPLSEIVPETQPEDDLTAGAYLPAKNAGIAIGRIEDERGKPIEGVTVKFESMEMAEEIEGAPAEVKAEFDRLSSFAVQTNHEGRFEFPLKEFCGGDEETVVPLRFVKDGYSDHVQMLHSSKDRLVVRLQSGTSITGTVRHVDGNPAANVLIRAYHLLRSPHDFQFEQLVWSEVKTDEQGRYKLLVQPDEYQIMARHPDGEVAWLPKQPSTEESELRSSRSRNMSSRTKLKIQRNETKQLDIQLEQSVEFHAKAINSLTGEPLAGIWFQQQEYPWIDSRTDDAGNVTIRSLPAGTINFTFTCDNYHRAWSDGAATAWKERHFQDPTTAPGMVPVNDGITFDLKPGMSPLVVSFEPAIRMTGRVVDPDGQPIGGIEVMSVRAAGSTQTTDLRRAWTKTAPDGRFELNVPRAEDGRSILMGSDRRPVDRSPNAGRPNVVSGGSGRRSWANGFSQPIQALPGEKIDDIELRMTRPGTIHGRIVTSNGQPMAAVPIQASSIDYLEQQPYRPSTTSDRNGQFTLTFVRPGRHKLFGTADSNAPSVRSAAPEVEVQSDQIVDVGDVVIPLIEDIKK